MWGAIAAAAGKAVDQGIDIYQHNKNMGLAYDQMNMQREFAQNGIRWRVADAKAAGIHPLAALGMSGPSYSPVSVAGALPSQIGSEMGQAVDRAMQAKQLQEERDLNKALTQANIDKVKAETNFVNQQAAASAASVAETALPPPMPVVNNENVSPVTYSSDVGPLLQLSRMGNVFVEHINPNLSDAITESGIKHTAVMTAAEGQSHRTKQEAYKRLSSFEKAQIRAGNADLYRITGVGWQFLFKKHMRPKFHKDGSVSGKFIPLQYW